MVLAKASSGWGGRGCGGPPAAGSAVVLGLGFGREAMPCTYRAYAPQLAADGSKPPIPMISDHVRDHSHVPPTDC